MIVLKHIRIIFFFYLGIRADGTYGRPKVASVLLSVHNKTV
jgi:hypothetical protein